MTMVGRVLQKYRLVEEVGQGGMAAVYRGVDTQLDREVAVKVLHPHLAGRADHRRRFHREARAVARLHHPNILEIFDYSGEESADSFIVTEFIRGTTLRRFAEAHPFDPPELAALCVADLCAALQHAHTAGIVHRDLKPENVMVRDDGVLKLTDFGIAQLLDREERLTMTGSLLGSPAHMPPEIIEGGEADARSDLFSLGTILYWLSCGKLPFDGPSPGAVMKRIIEGASDDPRSARPSVPDALAAVIAKAMARVPADRYASAAEMRAALVEVALDAGIEDGDAELRAFLREPAVQSEALRRRLVERLLERASRGGRITEQLAAYARALALEPTSVPARAGLERLKRRRAVRRWALRGLAAAALGAAVAMASAYWPAAESGPETEPVAASGAVAGHPTETTIGPVTEPDAGPETVAAEKTPHIAVPTPTTLAAAPARTTVRPRPPPPAAPPVPFRVIVVPYATVELDGQVLERDVKSFEGAAPPGKHRLRLTHPCCQPFDGEIELPLADPLRVRLEPRPALLRVKAPVGALVEIEGVSLGLASLSARDPFPVAMGGEYQRVVKVTVFGSGLKETAREVPVRAGQVHEIEVGP